ncbi:unnamed protein product [Cylindrotheca closterium]|uniref:Uncharacterized protein n=1 Tax=Cylindrotheca closterium TaxID=2856 RepID=A0AAD2JNR1_9STRA|nr:unnamed protein product [Cylindrotheca closterium]
MDMQTGDAQGFPAITYNPNHQNQILPSHQSPSKIYKYQSSSPQHMVVPDENEYIESQGIEYTYSETRPTPPASVAGSIARSVAKSLKSSSQSTVKSAESEDLKRAHHYQQQHNQQQQPQKNSKKTISHTEHTEKQQRAKKVFWVCFCSQLIVILILVIVWTSSPASLVEKSVLTQAENTASSGVLIGINDTFQINNWDEFLGLSDDDYFGDGTLCPSGIDTPIAVLTDKPCYARPDGTEGAYSEPIAVIFENCAPQPDDWIGIYDAEHNIFQPGIHRVDYWSWACGDQECQKPVRGGIIVFAGIQEYGNFKVHLHRREGEAEEMYLASSEIFTVQQTCIDYVWD